MEVTRFILEIIGSFFAFTLLCAIVFGGKINIQIGKRSGDGEIDE